MQLLRMQLRDFRLFNGSHTFEFAGTFDRNVTLIRAGNACGKTAFLDALYWCLYGCTSSEERLSDNSQKQLINFSGMAAGRSATRVCVYFEHSGLEYRIDRSLGFQDTEDVPLQSFTAYRVDDKSEELLESAKALVDAIIPMQTARYCFVGESLEYLLFAQNSAYLREAVQHIARAGIARTDVSTNCRVESAVVLKQRVADARSRINDLMGTISGRFGRPWQVKIGRDFSLKVHSLRGDSARLATGDKTFITITLLCALAQDAVSVGESSKKNVLGSRGLPLVFDSPLGRLDRKLRHEAAELLASTYGQIVLLLSDIQCGPEVVVPLQPRIGKQLDLIPSNDEGLPSVRIRIETIRLRFQMRLNRTGDTG